MLYMICALISRSAVQHTDYQTTSEIKRTPKSWIFLDLFHFFCDFSHPILKCNVLKHRFSIWGVIFINKGSYTQKYIINSSLHCVGYKPRDIRLEGKKPFIHEEIYFEGLLSLNLFSSQLEECILAFFLR